MPNKTTPNADATLPWPELIEGVLIRRYQRFKADIRLASGTVITAHCANTGRMTACCEPGQPAYVSQHDNPKRKLKYSWQLIQMPTSLVGVNTSVPNQLVAKAIEKGRILACPEPVRVEREVPIGPHSRLDIAVHMPERPSVYIEIKNCTWVEKGVARFPDAVTVRGTKHLSVLQQLVAEGHRCLMLYLIQRMDAHVFKPAAAIDPQYEKALRTAHANGVEAMAYDVHIDTQKISLRHRLPVEI